MGRRYLGGRLTDHRSIGECQVPKASTALCMCMRPRICGTVICEHMARCYAMRCNDPYKHRHTHTHILTIHTSYTSYTTHHKQFQVLWRTALANGNTEICPQLGTLVAQAPPALKALKGPEEQKLLETAGWRWLTMSWDTDFSQTNFISIDILICSI